MGRKIEFFIDNDNGNVKIKGLFKAAGACRTECSAF